MRNLSTLGPYYAPNKDHINIFHKYLAINLYS